MKTEATAQVEVAVPPDVAFEIFTTEIDLWWVRGPINAYDSSRLVERRIEPGVGGRVLEVYEEGPGQVAGIDGGAPSEQVLTHDRITAWDPGVRLTLENEVTGTEITFEPVGAGTRVRVRQFLLPHGDPERAGFGWANMLRAYGAWLQRRDAAVKAPRNLDRLGIALYYSDPGKAARWLQEVFQLGDWNVDRAPAPDETPSWIEFHVGNGLLMIFGSDQRAAAPQHEVWVHVDDLAAHHRHAVDHGATITQGIGRSGATLYRAEDLEGLRWTFVQAPPAMRASAPVDPR